MHLARSTIGVVATARVPRRGVTLIELLIAIFVIGLLLAIVLPAVMASRESSRRAGCMSNLRQLGIGLASYEASLRTFPCGAVAGNGQSLAEMLLIGPSEMGFRTNGFALMLPYIGEQTLASRYDYKKGWDNQPSHVVDQVIPLLVCPSASHENPHSEPLLYDLLDGRVTFGITDYVFCKGVFDGWCVFPRKVRRDERGMFDISFLRGASGFAVRAAQITDGLSKTIAMGEGACGPAWPVCQGPGCTESLAGAYAMNAWAAQPNFRGFAAAGLALTSTFGSTMDAINKNPVTQTVVWAIPGDVAGLFDCHSSTDWRGDGRAIGESHTSGFRSDHPGGALLLFADGSVQFLEESIDHRLFRNLSTIQGAEN